MTLVVPATAAVAVSSCRPSVLVGAPTRGSCIADSCDSARLSTQIHSQMRQQLSSVQRQEMLSL